MKRKISLIISFCIIVAVFVLGFFILRGKSKTSPTDNEQRFSSQEECREYVDSTFSFEWEEEWKRQGFIYCYCEDCELTEENRNILRENDYDILSLFPCYFDASFASNEEIETARKIAGLLTGYIVKTHGEDIFKTCSSSDYINEWLGTTDLGITYEDPFAANIGCYQFDTDLYYSFVAITERGEYIYFKPLDYWLDSAYEVRQFLFEFIDGTEAILSYIKREAPISYETIISGLPPKVEIYFDGSTSSFERGNYISLQDPLSVFHELIHIWLHTDRVMVDTWQREGIAVILPLLGYTDEPRMLTEQLYGIQKTLSKLEEEHGDIEVEPGSYKEVSVDAICLYVSLYGIPQTPEDIDMYLLDACVAKVQYLYTFEDQHGTQFTQIGKNNSSGLRNGNELTYYQAGCFIDYLIQLEGLETYLQAFMNEASLKETYGQPYPFLKKSFEDQFLDYEQIREAIDSVKNSYR